MSSPDPKALKEEFLAQNGKWSPQWESLLNLDPNYFAAYLKLRAAASKGKHVSPKFQELIHLSAASVVSTMFVPGIEAHTRAALDAGATKEEILGGLGSDLCLWDTFHQLRSSGVDGGPVGARKAAGVA